MNIRIITASAGSGKTTRLSQVLDEAIAAGAARPEGIVATTFTKEAAAELVERSRARLLASGRGRAAHKLLAARIGTVNSVCGALVTEFAFELGLSPALRVLDEASAELEQKRALAGVVDARTADELSRFEDCFQSDFDWHLDVRALIEAARANGLGSGDLARSAERSVAALDACLGPCAADGAAIDAELGAAVDQAIAMLAARPDGFDVTAKYLDRLRAVGRGGGVASLRWGDWAMLVKERPSAKVAAVAAPVASAALRHRLHPRLRADVHRLVRLLFQVASDGISAYERHKREHGLLDFADQEALALALLRRADVRDALRGELDLVLVDEFQDTSPLQLAIFLELAALARQSVWVGDQKQAIYGFRGTDPALMDAVIESLTATSTDPELVRVAVETIGGEGQVETLSTSYRSRPALVELGNAIFARAFASQGLPEERTRLRPVSPDEPAGLGPIVEHWPLLAPKTANKATRAAAVAAGVRDLLASGATVRDPASGAARRATLSDIAVLGRTNEQCQLVAEALADLGLAAVVPRVRLLDTAEGQLVVAGLRLWVDPRDALAAASLARLVQHAPLLGGLDALVVRALAAPGRAAFADDPIVSAIVGARDTTPDLDPVAALGAVIDAANARELCAAWGHAGRRLANLDALRGHAVGYVRATAAAREAPTLVGLLRHLDSLTSEWMGAARADRQALVAGEDAVTVSTWHRAKGREWPIVILFGLETVREPSVYGLHVESDATSFDVAAPLAGRWLRYWPNPYTTTNQGGPVRDALEQSPAYASVQARAAREVLRLLYVGFTRARDRVIFAAERGKLTAGLCGALTAIDRTLFSEPRGERPGLESVLWAGQRVDVLVRPVSPEAPTPLAPQPGEVAVSRIVPPRRRAFLPPSSAAPVPCTLGDPVTLGPRLPLQPGADMEQVGRALHDFFAADRRELAAADRADLAHSLLRRHGLADELAPADVVSAGSRLLDWLDSALAPTRCHREWPLSAILEGGTIMNGAADLVVRTASGYSIIDHKTFPGTLAAALDRLPSYSGQLASYAHAIQSATSVPVTSTWIHLAILGTIVELRLGLEVRPTGFSAA